MTIGNHTLPSEIMRTCSDGMLWCFSDWANTITNNYFWTMALFSFAVIVYLATSHFGNSRALGSAGFVCLVGGIWMAILTLISWWIASLFILGGIISFAIMIMSEK